MEGGAVKRQASRTSARRDATRGLLFLAAALVASSATATPISTTSDPTVCISGWSLFEGRCYQYFAEKLDHTSAEQACAGKLVSEGLVPSLPSIHTNAENDYVWNTLGCKNNDFAFATLPTYYTTCLSANCLNGCERGPRRDTDGFKCFRESDCRCRGYNNQGNCPNGHPVECEEYENLPPINTASGYPAGSCWLGLYRLQGDGTTNWQWTDESTYQHTNNHWTTGENDGTYYCGANVENSDDGEDGYWMDDDCTSQRDYVCTYQAKCPAGYYRSLDYQQGDGSSSVWASPDYATNGWSPGVCAECPAGTYRTESDDESACIPCPAGRFGQTGTLSATDQCAGACPQGYYCPEGSSPATYIACSAGKYGIAPGGWGTELAACDSCYAGYYCTGGETDPAPAGQLCDAAKCGFRGQSTSACSSACPAGYYCPAGSACLAADATGATFAAECGANTPAFTQPQETYCPAGVDLYVQVPDGEYGIAGSDPLRLEWTQSSTSVCEKGYYCEKGVRYSCPAGSYRDEVGGTSEASCPACAAGSFCPAQSVSATQERCAPSGASHPAEYYCPEGTTSRLIVPSGQMTIPTTAALDARQGFQACPADKVCDRGLAEEKVFWDEESSCTLAGLGTFSLPEKTAVASTGWFFNATLNDALPPGYTLTYTLDSFAAAFTEPLDCLPGTDPDKNANIFEVDPATGELRLLRFTEPDVLEYEICSDLPSGDPEYVLTVTARAEGEATVSEITCQLTLTVEDRNDAPVFDQDVYYRAVYEKQPKNTAVTLCSEASFGCHTTAGVPVVEASGDAFVTAAEEDALSSVQYTFLGSPDPRFEIDRCSGLITMNSDAALSLSEGGLPVPAGGSNVGFTFTVQAEDNGNGEVFPHLTDTTTVIVYILNVNDDPVLADPGSVSLTIPENAPAGTVVGDMASVYPVFDEDGDDVDILLTSNDAGAFEIVGNQIQTTSTGAADIDFESAKKTYTLQIQADDGNDGFDVQTYVVTVTNANDPPAFIEGTTFYVAEEQSSGAAVCRGVTSGVCVETGVDHAVQTTDPDNVLADVTTYSFPTPSPLFDIDPSTGQITTKVGISFEDTGALTELPGGTGRGAQLVVTASSSGAGIDSVVQTTDTTVTVYVVDVNEAPTLTVASPQTILENHPLGVPIDGLTMTGSDPDNADVLLFGEDAPMDTLTYSLSGVDTGATDGAALFQVTTTAAGVGVVSPTSELDYETAPTGCAGAGGEPCYTLSIRVTDNGGPVALFSDFVLTVVVVDVNEPPSFPDVGYLVAEDLDPFSTVNIGGLVSGTDDDSPSLTYSLVGGNADQLFGVSTSPAGAQVYKLENVELDFETSNTEWTLLIQAEDEGPPARVGSGCAFVGGFGDCPAGSYCNGNDLRCYETCYNTTSYVGTGVTSGTPVPYVDTYFCDYAGVGETPVGPAPYVRQTEKAVSTVTLQIVNRNDAPYVKYSSGITPTALNNVDCKLTSSISKADEDNPQIAFTALPIFDDDVCGAGFPCATDVTFSTTGGDFWAAFDLTNAATGEITLPVVTTIESIGHIYNGTITISDGSDSSVCSLAVTVADDNTRPNFADPTPISVDENTEAFTVLYATMGNDATIDPDVVTLGQTLTYTTSAVDGFILGPGSQLTTSEQLLDYESLSSTVPPYTYTLLVRVTDSEGAEDTADVVITVNDVNEAPSWAAQAVALTLPENSGNGVLLEALGPLCSDPDVFSVDTTWRDLTFEFADGGCGSDAACPFEFSDTDTGVLTPISGADLDFEGATNRWDFDVVCKDGPGLNATKTISISLTDVNEPPQFLAVPVTPTIVESDSSTSSQFLLDMTVYVTDPDDAVADIDFTITSGDPNAAFVIVNGQLLANGSIDYEEFASYTLGITANDTVGNEVSSSVSIDVLNANDVTVTSVTSPSVFDCAGSTSGNDVVVQGTNFGLVSGSPPAEVNVTFTRATSNVDLDSPVYALGGCSVTTANTEITCTEIPPGVGSALTWTVSVTVPTTQIERDAGASLETFRSYEAPAFTSLAASGDEMSTAGAADVVVLGGTCLGGPDDALTFVADGDFVGRDSYVRYCNDMGTCYQPENCEHTALNQITCDSVAGLGDGLEWSTKIATRSDGGAYQDGSYGDPVVTSVYIQGSLSSVLPTDGNLPLAASVVVFGSNFGEVGSEPDFVKLEYVYGGGPTEEFDLLDCVVTTAHVEITCQSVQPGVGADLPVRVAFADQISASNPSAVLSYGVATITAIGGDGAQDASTVGGQLVTLQGSGFGPRCGVAADGEGEVGSPCAYVVASYTRGSVKASDGVTVLSYAPQCAVASDALIVCTTLPGTGAGHAWSVAIAEQDATNLGGTTSYSAPTVGTYSGPGSADADTRGAESVTLLGSGFGPADGALIEAYYGDELDEDEFYAGACVRVSQTEITCTTTEGAGDDLAWIVYVDAQESTAELTSYGEPQVASFAGVSGSDPAALSPDGGETVIVSGLNFGPNTSPGPYLEAVTYGPASNLFAYAATCFVLSPGHSQLQCTTQPGIGTDLKWRVSVKGQTSVSSFNTTAYDLPFASQLTVLDGATDGGYRARIVGSSFGVCDPDTTQTVTFGGKLAVISAYYDGDGVQVDPALDCPLSTPLRQLEFTVPEMTDVQEHVVGLTVESTKLVAPIVLGQTFNFRYNDSNIDNVYAEPGGAGGAIAVTLIGENFCASEACCQTYVDGALASSTVEFHSHRRIRFLAETAGTAFVRCGGVDTETIAFDSQNPYVVSTDPVLSSLTMNTKGPNFNPDLAIYGLFFGSVIPPNVTIGGNPAPFVSHEVVDCDDVPPTTFVFDETMTCFKNVVKIPVGQGRDQELIVRAGSLDSLPDSLDYEFVQYTPPDITSITPDPAYAGPHPSAGDPGLVLSLVGTNFGADPGVVTFGNADVTCTPVSWDHELVRCSIPKGEGFYLEIRLTVSEQSDGWTNKYVSYDPPVVSSLSAPAFATKGGDTLTISGSEFGRPYDRFCADFAECTSVAPTVVIAGAVDCPVTASTATTIECTLPEGEGTGLSVLVCVAGQCASSPAALDYDPPVLLAVTPPTGPTDGIVPGGTARQLLEIDGENFGNNEVELYMGTPGFLVAKRSAVNELAAVGGLATFTDPTTLQQVEVYRFSPGTGHEKLVVELPEYYGENLVLSVRVAGQASTTNVLFSYDTPTVDAAQSTDADGNPITLDETTTGSGSESTQPGFGSASGRRRRLAGAPAFGDWSTNSTACESFFAYADVWWTTDISITQATGAYTRTKTFYSDSACTEALFTVAEGGVIADVGTNAVVPSCGRNYVDTVSSLVVTPASVEGATSLNENCPCANDNFNVGSGLDLFACLASEAAPDDCPILNGYGLPSDPYGVYFVVEDNELYMSLGRPTEEAAADASAWRIPDVPTAVQSSYVPQSESAFPGDGCYEWESQAEFFIRVAEAPQGEGAAAVRRICTNPALIELDGTNFGSDVLNEVGALRVFLVDTNGAEYEASTTTSAGNHGQFCTAAMGCQHDHTKIIFWVPNGGGRGLSIRVSIGGLEETLSNVFVDYAGPVTGTLNPGTVALGGFQSADGGQEVTVTGTNLGQTSGAPDILIGGRLCADPKFDAGEESFNGRPFWTCTTQEDVVGPKSVLMCVSGQASFLPKVESDVPRLLIGELTGQFSPSVDLNYALSNVLSRVVTQCPVGKIGRLFELCEDCPVGANCSDTDTTGSFVYPPSETSYFLEEIIVEDKANPGSVSELAQVRCSPYAWQEDEALQEFPDVVQRETCFDYSSCEPKEACLGANQCADGYEYAYYQCSEVRGQNGYEPRGGEPFDNACSVVQSGATNEWVGVDADCRGDLPIDTACTSANPEACSRCVLTYDGANSTAPPVGTCECEVAPRCSLCTMRTHFRLYNECEPCPENPGLLIAMFFLGAIGLLIGGYVLSRKRLNLAFISIGVDYFQVLAIFASSKIAWPPYIERVFEIFSIFNFNIDLTAPECLIPELEYETKWYFTEALPLAALAILLLMHLGYTAYKLTRQGLKVKFWSHIPKLVAVYIVMFYYLYLSVTKRALDVFNCNPLDPSDGFLYTSFTSLKCDGGGLCRCGEEGGVQQGLVPAAIVALCVYSLGFPMAIMGAIYLNREKIVEDQYLRAYDVGHTRSTNARAYDVRKKYQLMYYHFKPDYVYWILFIIIRKFGIAFSSLMFRGNPTFQLSVALLVLFWAFLMHVRAAPFMSPGHHENVRKNLEKLANKASSDPEFLKYREIQKRCKAAARVAEEEARKAKASKYYKRGFWQEADKKHRFVKKNRATAAGQYFFDLNSVESILLASAILICLAGIMFESGKFETEREDLIRQQSVITTLTFVILFGSISYYALVFMQAVWPKTFSRSWASCFAKRVRINSRDLAEMLDKDVVLDDNPLLQATKIKASTEEELQEELDGYMASLAKVKAQNRELSKMQSTLQQKIDRNKR